MNICNIEIIPTERRHLWELAENLRENDEKEIMGFGFSNRRVLWQSYRQSIFSRTALIDGKVAAIWGVGGVLMGDTGRPWLLTSPESLKVSPLRFARIYRREVQKMLKLFPNLENFVDSTYNQAVRLLEIVGFKLDEPQPIGKTGAMFRRFKMCGQAHSGSIE